MQTMEDVAEQIADISRKLEQLRLASETASTVPTVQVAEGNILEARPDQKKISDLVGAGTRTVSSPAPGETRVPERAPNPHHIGKRPVQTMFGGKDFRLFLQRYKRWSSLAGLYYQTE